MRIIIDFDETITEQDTISKLLSLPKHVLPPSHFTQVYLDAYREFSKSSNPVITINDEIAYQQRLKAVEMTSINELQHQLFFQGVTKQQIRGLSSNITIKPGFARFLNLTKTIGIPLTILSINWTSVLIKEVLATIDHGHDDIEVFSNELEFNNDVCTGRFTPIDIRTGFDKYNYMKRFHQQSPIIYIGDSRTDLLSLLQSDIGIIINSGSILKKLPWDINIQPLSNFDEFKSSSSQTLFKGDWSEITKFIESYSKSQL